MTVAGAGPAGGEPLPEPAQPAPRVIEVIVSVPTVVKALGIFFGVLLVFLVKDALLSILLSMVFVLGLDPLVSALERRGWGRGKAALVVLGALVAAVFVIVVWAVNPLWDAVHEFADNLPGWVQEAKNSGIMISWPMPMKRSRFFTQAAMQIDSEAKPAVASMSIASAPMTPGRSPGPLWRRPRSG